METKRLQTENVWKGAKASTYEVVKLSYKGYVLRLRASDLIRQKNGSYVIHSDWRECVDLRECLEQRVFVGVTENLYGNIGIDDEHHPKNMSLSYVDEDGEEVLIVSDDDIADLLFFQKFDKPVTIYFKKWKKSSSTLNPDCINNAEKCTNKEALHKMSKKMGSAQMKKDSEVSKHRSVTPFLATHYGIVCDGCSVTPIIGPRFKSVSHPDFDLCQSCEYTRQDIKKVHKFIKLEKPLARNPFMRVFKNKWKEAEKNVNSHCTVSTLHSVVGCKPVNLTDYDKCRKFTSKKNDDVTTVPVKGIPVKLPNKKEENIRYLTRDIIDTLTDIPVVSPPVSESQHGPDSDTKNVAEAAATAIVKAAISSITTGSCNNQKSGNTAVMDKGTMSQPNDVVSKSTSTMPTSAVNASSQSPSLSTNEVATTTSEPSGIPKEKLQRTLFDMGFCDKEKNSFFLEKNENDLDRTVDDMITEAETCNDSEGWDDISDLKFSHDSK